MADDSRALTPPGRTGCTVKESRREPSRSVCVVRGRRLPPELVEFFGRHAPMLLSELDCATTWDVVIAAKPSLKMLVCGERLDDALEARAEVAAGRLDGDSVDAVLRAAGHRVRRRREWPAGLTARELEVLRLLVQGLSNEEIADQLVISKKTAGSHIEHIYTKRVLPTARRQACSRPGTD